MIIASLFSCCVVFAQAQDKDKKKIEHGCPLEEVLLKRIEPAERVDIERASKQINVKFGTGSWSTKETRTEIQGLLRHHLPNASEEVLVTAEAVLFAKTLCAFVNDSGNEWVFKRRGARDDLRRAQEDMAKQQEAKENANRADNVKNVKDLISLLIQIDSQARNQAINPLR